MLKQRVITAAILIPIFIWLIFKLPAWAFSLVTMLFVLIGAWEWSLLMGLTTQQRAARLSYVFFVVVMLKASLFISLPILLSVTVLWWLLALILILRYPNMVFWDKTIFLRALMGLLVLIPTWLAMNNIRADYGPSVLLFLCVLIWGADSGAYFAGKKWGKDKLLPQVSPGKTRQGLYGALFTTVLITLVVLKMSYFASIYSMWPVVMLVALMTTLFSIEGDLFESMLKRNVGLKDSGTLFPGHGGLLDRIDSLTAAAPLFALCLHAIVCLF
jgi:phosphatidate cytidylyltransferase